MKRELIVVRVKECDNHHEICKFIKRHNESLKDHEVLVLPEGAEVLSSKPSGFIDITNFGDTV